MRNTRHSNAGIGRVISGALMGAFVIFAATATQAADIAATTTQAAGDDKTWWSHGGIEVGTNQFIQDPPNGYSYSSSKGDFLTTREIDSEAKLFEYGEYPDVFSILHLQGGRNDGAYFYDFLAESIGNDNQHYSLDLQKTGRHYLTLDWDEIPHLSTTSAKSVFAGVGTTSLTVDPAMRATLDGVVADGATGVETVAGRQTAKKAINAHAARVEMKIQREKGTVDYTFTGEGKWSATAHYTNEKREGEQAFALNWGYTDPNANAQRLANADRPTQILELAEPIDDRTQNLTLGVQRVGSTPWGAWVEQFQYFTSWYDNSLTALNVQNPWCSPPSLNCDGVDAVNPGGATGFPVYDLRLGLLPSNEAHSFTLNGAIDLPLRSRLTRTLQYSKMEQDEPFVDAQTINGLIRHALPAYNANAEIETLLSNNTLTSKLGERVSSTLKYRYYDVDNKTPELIWPEYFQANGPRQGAERRNLAMDYTKQNASGALNVRATERVNIGASFGWEQYDRDRRDANVTDEYTGKIYGDARIGEGTVARGSVAYSERRYDRYDAHAFIAVPSLDEFSENWGTMRKFSMANRDRLKLEGFVDVPIGHSFVLTPTGGVDYNDYPDNTALHLGLKKRNGWNAGVDLFARLAPQIDLTAGFNFEKWKLHLDDCCGNGGYALDTENIWSSDIDQKFYTVHAGLNIEAIPDRLKMIFGYNSSFSSEDIATRPCSSNRSGCRGGQFPGESVWFQRFKAELEYSLDRKRGGLKDEPTREGPTKFVKVGYIFEKSDTENWAVDDMEPYIGTGAVFPDELTGADRSIFMAWYDPNYTAQIIYGSIGIRW